MNEVVCKGNDGQIALILLKWASNSDSGLPSFAPERGARMDGFFCLFESELLNDGRILYRLYGES